MCGGCHNLLRQRPKCQAGSGNPALIAARLERQEQQRKRQEAEKRRREMEEKEQRMDLQPQQEVVQEPKVEVKQEVRRSKICGICNGEAETYHLNYGASSCFSCRAFFRRVVQKASADKLKCKFDGNCDLDPKSTTKCRKCRYDRCIDANMQPGMVLQGTEKITRFRKLITKQMEAEGKLIKRVDTGTGPKKRGRKKKALVSDLPEEFKVGIKLSFKKSRQGGSNNSTTTNPDNDILQNVQLAGILNSATSTASPQSLMSFTSSPTSSYSSGDEPMHQMPSSQFEQEEESPKVEDLLKSSVVEFETVETQPANFDERLLDLGSYYGSEGSLVGSPSSYDDGSSSSGDSVSSPVVIDNSLMDFITKQVLEQEPSPAPSFEELMEEVEVVSPGTGGGCKAKTCVCKNILCGNHAGCKNGGNGVVDIEAQYSHLLEMKAEKPVAGCLGSEEDSYKEFAVGMKEKRETVWQLKQLQKTWMLACLGTDFDLVGIQNILLYHFGHREAMTLDTVKQHITKLVQLFYNFAKQQKEFVSLSTMEQAKILSANAPLFIQYMLGRYFNGAAGKEQIRWILVNGIPTNTMSEDVANALKGDFDTFNESVCLFDDATAAQVYKEHLKNLTQVSLPHVTTGHIALAILFRGSEKLIDLAPLERVLKKANKASPFSLAILNNSLKGMAELFEKHTVETFDATTMAHQICLNNSIDEEAWLSGVLASYKDISGAVNLGNEMVNEFLMFNLDVPFSQHYTEVLGQIVRERMTRVLAYSQDFQSLNYDEQTSMIKYNVPMCMTLHLARCCASNASQQVMRLMGKEDLAHFDSNRHVLHDRPLRKISLADISKNMAGEDMAKFTVLSSSLASYVRDEDLFDVLVHCLLFSSEHLSNSPRVKALESRFFLALERRLLMKSSLAAPSKSHVEVLKKYLAVIQTVKDLSGLVTKYLLHVKEEA